MLESRENISQVDILFSCLSTRTYSHRSLGWVRSRVRVHRVARSWPSNTAGSKTLINQRHTHCSKLCSAILYQFRLVSPKRKNQNTWRVSPLVFHLCCSLLFDFSLFIWVWSVLLYPLVWRGLWLFVWGDMSNCLWWMVYWHIISHRELKHGLQKTNR